MIPHFQRVQRAGRPLLIKGAFTHDELKMVLDSLEPRGLFLNVMVESVERAGELRLAVGM